MQLEQFKKAIHELFPTTDNPIFHDECGFTTEFAGEISRVGYCTNLTMDSVEQAIEQQVDMLITHHDAWDFVFGLREACQHS